MQQMLMNGKFGAVCTKSAELYVFGVQTTEGVGVDFEVCEEIAAFGITSASSVNRMMQNYENLALKVSIATISDRYRLYSGEYYLLILV